LIEKKIVSIFLRIDKRTVIEDRGVWDFD